MKSKILIMMIILSFINFKGFAQESSNTYTLNVEVENLRNSKGIVQFAIYNEEGSIPDEHFKKYYKLGITKIIDGKASFSFKKLPEATYAVSIHHDENENGKIDKGFIKPKEGIGFSNLKSIGLTNKPSFLKSSFELDDDKSISIIIIYM